ncbi:hypothetical protein [Brevundimonas balnearis]|uniref:PRC-barrel domain-containing protein n=1 Tax=Brevundimonas balnearis TaxID=1572858 RepID=A0ABV6R1U3_9CAUL
MTRLTTRNTLFAGAALALVFSAPALAQDAMSPAQEPAQEPVAEAAAQTQQTLTLNPGSNVLGSDGSTLGTLEGVRTNAEGQQELTVRGADGQIRGVPVNGIAQQGADVRVAWSAAEFGAAEVIAEGDAGVTATPPATSAPMPADEAPAGDTTVPPTLPTEPVGQPDVDDAMDDPTAPPQEETPAEPDVMESPEG